MGVESAVLEQAVEAPVAKSSLVRAAGVIAIGNIASRALGLVREIVIAYLFGATGYVSIFRVAATLVQTLYDFLVGGMVSAALVPIFSDFAARENREDLWRIASVAINVIAIALAIAVLLLEVLAPFLVWILGSGYDAPLQDAAVVMIRLILPAIFFLGLSGVITGLLYTLRRFAYPAFTTAAFNLGIVIVALAFSSIYGITSLIVGVIAGSALQVALQLPGLRGMNYRATIDFSHPALRKILRLYIPVVGGLTISVIGVAIDRNLASHTGAQSLAWMQNATTLIQFPLGLVATAISFAILPTLSRQSLAISEQAADSAFQSTLAFGIKLVLLLILPASIGLFVLARPIVSLLFEHGAFTSTDTFWTATALQLYSIGLPFAAIDQPLVFAFYARKNTLTPNLVAFAGVAIYLAVALALIQSLGMRGLVIANSAQLTGHALIMLWLTQTRLGGLRGQGVIALAAKTFAASVVMGVIVFAALQVIEQFGASNAIGARVLNVLVPGIAALIAYILILRILRVPEATQVWEVAWTKFRQRAA